MIFDKKWIVVFIILCLSACSIRFFPSKDEWYAKHYIIMQEFEWKVYKELMPAAKIQFQELFWEVRDPDSQLIFSDRLDYVMENFKKENYSHPWTTDRGRIFLLNGNPAEIRYVDNTDLGGVAVVSSITAAEGGRNVDRSKEDIAARMSEVWFYPHGGNYITYQFNFAQPRQWKLDPRLTGSQFLGDLERHSREKTYRIIDVERYKEQLEELKKIK